MIKYFNHRRRSKQLQKDWEDLVIALTNAPGVTKIEPGVIVQFASVFDTTLISCALDKVRLNKATLRVISVIKRILADKRMFDAIKCVDYLLAAYNVSQYKMREDVQEKATTHLWSMGNLYLQMVLDRQQSNPFAPGEILKQLEKSDDTEHNNKKFE
jgi:hypothetical protein